MHIKLTLAEATEIVQAKLLETSPSCVANITVEIEPPASTEPPRNYIPISAQAIYDLAQGGSKKIIAIRFLREATPGITLCIAKKVVEAIMVEGKFNSLICNDSLSIPAWITAWTRLNPDSTF